MTYRKVDFAEGLKARLKHGYDPIGVSRWAYEQYLGNSNCLEEGLKSEIMKVVAMEEGFEFEMTKGELMELADALMG